MSISFSWKIKQKYDGMLVREFLRSKVELSRRALIDLKFNGGQIAVNGKEVSVRHTLVTNDELSIFFPDEKRSEILLAERLPLHIVYEDDHVLIINKESNMSTIPSKEHPTSSLANGLIHYYNENGYSYAVHIVTRLDRDTSGLLLVAKHRFAHHLLSLQQKDGDVNRTYSAILHGFLSEESGMVDLPIGRHPDSIIERTIREDGKHALTNYEVVERTTKKTLVKLRLETGRTHQIRVHMAAIGHPLIGDTLYGGKRDGIDRQALHCCNLSFIHPFTKEKMTFESDLPKDMTVLWQTP
ncbi:RNA pseudouridine synthase [Lottiidibacillus patelloidae]|uniref:Pseudouridine synthase n=1 Tax=Lottiidibacillus patelloidae TaxID=2670334 RepID=A0A263BX01_9BACI|nr:RluA family pseudouridine synthase [Lottiidibacillus patelloidae]OZM58281.1 RNA pseudouridine synthase [Lottiidibacillus patelloidae]